MNWITYSFCLLTGLLAGPVLALALSKPAPGEVALVIAPPWVDRDHAITASFGRIVGPLTSPFGTLATSSKHDFDETLKTKGVWFVVDGNAIAKLCGLTL